MREVRAETAIGHGSRDRVTVDASRHFEYSLALRNGITDCCRLALLLNPAIKLILRLNVDAQQHLGVLRPAILGALTQIHTRVMGINPHTVRVVRNQIGLACQTRYPEAVIRIRGQQLNKRRGWMIVIANRHMQFVRGYDSESGIAILPPELMANGYNLDRIVGSHGLLHAGNHSRGRHKQRHNNEDWDDGPSELYLIAAVHLGRLTPIVIFFVFKLNDSVEKQSEND